MCPILRGKMGLKYAARAGGAGERDGRGGRSPPTDGFCVVWGGVFVERLFLGAPPPCPLFVHSVPRAKRSNARPAMSKAIRHRDDHSRHAETRKRQFAPTTSTKSVFLWGATPVSLGKTKEMGWHWPPRGGLKSARRAAHLHPSAAWSQELAGGGSCSRRWRSFFRSLYTVAVTGTPRSMPVMPETPPPTVTAASTQRPGRPMEPPTTRG